MGGNVNIDGTSLLVNSGTLDLSGGASLGVAVYNGNGDLLVNSGSLTVHDGATLDMVGDGINGVFLENNGTLTVTDTGFVHVERVDMLNNNSGGTLEISGGTMTIDAWGTLTNYSAVDVTDDGSLTLVSGGAYGYAMVNDGNLAVHDGGTVTMVGGGYGIVNGANGADINVSAGGAFTVGSGAALENDSTIEVTSGGTFTIGDAGDDFGVLTNLGTLTISGGTVEATAQGELTNAIGGSIEQSAGSLHVTSGGELDLAGTFSVSGGTISNDGLVVLNSNDVSFATAINSYGTNTGKIAFNGDDVDLSGLTLNGGTYEIWG